ncbi:hypothetical protein BS50DRAFT_500562, partial [Corynespora cassiicola Philippines]
QDWKSFLYAKLNTTKLDGLHPRLWLADIPRPTGTLYRWELLNREIFLAESPDGHLAYFIRPLPHYLLDDTYRKPRFFPNWRLHKSVSRLLLSYA